MSIIQCPECGKEISDRAEKCPNCGYPIHSATLKTPYNNQQNGPYSQPIVVRPYVEKQGHSVLGILSLIFSIIGCTWLIGAILAIVDLCKKDDKKKTCSIIGLVISCIWLLLIIFASALSDNDETNNIETTATEDVIEYTEPIIEEEDDQTVEETVNQSVNEQANNNIDEEKIIRTGTYIVGEDILSGKYNFIATKGTGTLYIYNSYEDYKSDEYGYDAFRHFDMLANGASVGLLNADVYTDKVSNIRISDGQCLAIDNGLELYYEVSENLADSEMGVGIYIVGEDIVSGKYDFEAIKGSGSLMIYNTYDEYLDDKYGYDAFQAYDMKEENASVGMLNEDIYTNYVSNVKLEDGQCIYIEKGLKIKISGD